MITTPFNPFLILPITLLLLMLYLNNTMSSPVSGNSSVELKDALAASFCKLTLISQILYGLPNHQFIH